MSDSVGVGFLGAGPVTQAIHLPHLAGLSDRLHVAHVMDIDAAAAAEVAWRAGEETRHSTSAGALLDDDDVEIVAICSPHPFHAQQAEAAIRAGKKAVLVEKPFATTVEDAERVATLSQATGVPVIVGAMHTYDPAYLAAAARWGELPAEARHVRSVIQLPPNSRFEALATQLHGTPSGPPRRDLADPTARAAAIRGSVLGLAIHDLPLVRRFLPGIDRVGSAELLVPFGYRITLHGPDGRTAELIGHMGTDWRPEWTFEVWSASTALDIDFTPSYVRAGSAEACLRTPGERVRFGPHPHNGYEAEWIHLADLARGSARPLHTPGDLVADLAYAIDVADRAAAIVSTQGAAPCP
ncbi:Gfo/Idh/MocA family oxidoreductase [Saccharopolyspora sp. K220]|uniref:Gfo/Idh/MocA family protein n=1 Tax=Saccharopolyspora soli TaxID=2926618 RepID=UPI001F580D6F|nr:Gfo/Idh/MocA family oxidoreductase [Saccharopolyspora soli]MCI2423651.1 Gfo/Idh/MocA family oxidoreductase [Saccharopolyspora soli]